jgi:RNA polymerase sigma-70 factor (ECF subfamily)
LDRDEDLFADGGDAAMTQLVGRYERPLFRFLLQMVGDAQLAEDLFQETFLRLHRSRARYQPGQPLKPYLYRIAINLVRDSITRRSAQPKSVSLDSSPSSGDGEGPVLKDALPAATREPSDNMQRSELQAGVRSAVARLPQAEREVLVLRVFEGLSFPEIAAATDVPLPTAKSRMVYALRRLRPALEGYVCRTSC